jgi:Putative lumazine-binding
MQDDIRTLEQLNIRIGVEETKGDDQSRSWLADAIAPKLAFGRADRTTIDNREEFLKRVKSSDPRETEIESIDLHGNRAVVSCIVTLKSANGDKKFHNLRLFVRHEEEWKLLGWANEPL